ncbi:MAG: alkaline phosphatase family protein [Xanthomonadales bacterium]|nr:alkaline phosphatase family protein [Xanthomonadales bacterium]
MRSLLILLLITLCGCQTTLQPRQDARIGTGSLVLLVSIDGTRVDYLDRGLTPNLQRLIDEGVRARWMTPAYPSLTFPNHYTLVTGLRPDHHGIVQNTMYDPELGTFALADRDAVTESRWWEGLPIWVSAERAGIDTAVLFWPGSEAAIDGVRPGYWQPYDDKMGYADRVDTIVAWLAGQAAEADPVALATLYFERVDKMGHEHGPESTEVRAAMAEADEAIGRLLQGLSDAKLLDRVNIIVVADHGMAEVAPNQFVHVDQMVDPNDAQWISLGQSAGFQPRRGRAAAAARQLLGRHEHYECWRKADLPARWHYGSHRRVPPIVCQMDEGWDALAGRAAEWRAQFTGTRGSHGFDPALPSMQTIFVARGPAFRSGAELPPIESVDVYTLLAHLLGLRPAPNDGNAEALLPALR